jgi:RimJ/RimL family protein N-acetyltransferase
VTTIEGRGVHLRPFAPDEFDAVVRSVVGAEPTVAVGDANVDDLRARLENSGELTERELLMAIASDGRLLGSIQAYRDGLPAGVFGLGIELFDEVDRGRGHGAEAVALLTAHLFDHEGARRVEAGTAEDNVAMRRVLSRLGFRQEGVLRRWYPADDGAGVDCVMYGMTNDDYEEAKTTWT